MPLTLAGMALANGLVALQVAARAGIGTFISEYIRLLITFADDTGGAMRQMELHDMVYGWGVMVIYYAIHKEKNHKTQAVCFLISMLFFTLGFKRIAVPAALGAAVMYHCLCWRKPKHIRALANIMALAAGGCIFFYLWLIKSGIFVELANELEIDLMYRDVIYTYFSDFLSWRPAISGEGSASFIPIVQKTRVTILQRRHCTMCIWKLISRWDSVLVDMDTFRAVLPHPPGGGAVY